MNEEFARIVVAVLFGEDFAPPIGPELAFLREQIVEAFSTKYFFLRAPDMFLYLKKRLSIMEFNRISLCLCCSLADDATTGKLGRLLLAVVRVSVLKTKLKTGWQVILQ